MRATGAVGRYGEQVAVDHLVRAGYRVLDRNWRCRWGELDVVAADGGCLVAVEVKTRRSTVAGHPLESVTPAKLARLRRLTSAWLHEHRDRWWDDVRIDVVAVLCPPGAGSSVEHLQGVG